VPDEELPMLAASWLVQGYEGAPLQVLAGMSATEARTEARRLLPQVLQSLGYPERSEDQPWDGRPWRGYWNEIEWAVSQVDSRFRP